MRLITMAMVLGLQSGFAFADEKAAKWDIVPEESHVVFTATLNHAPVKGEFDHFDAEIYFDPEQLDKSSVKAEIEMTSVRADNEEISLTLTEKDWFDVNAFPRAVFEANKFNRVEGNHYEASGTLIIRGISVPMTLPFTLDISNQGNTQIANMQGKTTLKRTLYGVGQGQWKDTKTVEDDVVVEVAIKAQKAE